MFIGRDLLPKLLSEIPLSQESMLFWWPRVKDLDVPKPETFIIRFDKDLRLMDVVFFEACVYNEKVDGVCERVAKVLKEKAEEARRIVKEHNLGYPVFMRTDQTSLKHDTLFEPFKVKNADEFYWKMRYFIAYGNRTVTGFPEPRAFAIRRWINPVEWIPRGSLNNNPYNKVEARLFVLEGRVIAAFPYYHINGLVLKYEYLKVDWDYVFERYKNVYIPLFSKALPTLTEYASAIGKRLGGYWSIDFMLGEDGTWYFIDAAPGELSWAPPPLSDLPPEAKKLLERFRGDDGFKTMSQLGEKK